MISLMSVDSNEMDEQKWLQLREVINQQAARDDVNGIVVTHGTDTIEETAFSKLDGQYCQASRFDGSNAAGNCYQC